jgi:uncharacterized protein (DUF58 family)
MAGAQKTGAHVVPGDVGSRRRFPAVRDLFTGTIANCPGAAAMTPTEMMQAVRKVEIRARALASSAFQGAYASSFRGPGLAFREVRPYEEGDDVRYIEWNVSARMQRPFVKVFEEEREQTVMLAVDISPSLEVGPDERTKRKVATEMCATLALAAIEHGDRAGLALFTDHVEAYLAAGRGRDHARAIIHQCLSHQARGKRTSISAASGFIGRLLPRRAIVVVFTDLEDAGAADALARLAHRHEVIVVELRAAVDEVPWNVGLLEIWDEESEQRRVIDTADRRAMQAHRAAIEALRTERRQRLVAAGVDHFVVRVEDDYYAPLVRFLRERAFRRR